MYVWNHEAYRDDIDVSGWYKYIGYDASDEAVGIEAEIEVDFGGWDMQ